MLKKLIAIFLACLIFPVDKVNLQGTFNGILSNQWLLNFGLSSNAVYVVLKNKNIQSIDPNAFNGYTSTFTLNLANNRITQLRAGVIDKLLNLRIFDVSYNLITSVESGTFQNLRNLVTINLEFNQISTLDERTFTGLNNLSNLFLTRNRLTQLSGNLLSGLTHFNDIFINFMIKTGLLKRFNQFESRFICKQPYNIDQSKLFQWS